MVWLLMALSTRAESPAGWRPVSGTLLTRWAAEVSPTNAHPEYPRPQLVRSNWLNLNGLWEYAILPSAERKPAAYSGPILVPFPVESALSGVQKRLDERSTLWYRRPFQVPSAWSGCRVRLHFGAVDWQTQVLINGRAVGQHRGGYDPFTFDITDALKRQGPEELLVAVTDPTEGDQPHGKQSAKPEGIFYTATSGIWQTVWLEPVPEVCIDGLRLVPESNLRELRLRATVNSLSDTLTLEAVARAAGQEVGRVRGPAHQDLLLAVATPHLWSPDDPFLYDLSVTLRDGDRVVDCVDSYFALRKIGLRKDGQGVMRLALNDEFLFQVGSLDQGFWPDGVYTAPTDAALRYDIEFLKQAGFNLARKHVKVEPERWYYWCDKLGLLVWQDMPSSKNATPEGRLQFEAELQHEVEGLANHPSIIMWVLFNEGWGQYDTERLTQWVKRLDPSRLVDNASGWTDRHVGDVVDTHSYPGPKAPAPEAERAAVLGEFGGLGLRVDGHTWSRQFWAYQAVADSASLTARYAKLMNRAWALRASAGLSAVVYTQTTDVETEGNGLLTYDRAVSKLDLTLARQVNRGEFHDQPLRVLAANALTAKVVWQYTTQTPGPDWFKPGFTTSGWKEGLGGFGVQNTPGALLGTEWKTDDIWLRREISLNPGDLREALLQLHHDEDAEVYLNGVLATEAPGFVTEYYELPIRPEAAATLKAGSNLLAVHCHQTSGGQYIDVGLVTPVRTPAKP
jgi:hypothetical protein